MRVLLIAVIATVVVAAGVVFVLRDRADGPPTEIQQIFTQFTDLLDTDPAVAVAVAEADVLVRTFDGVDGDRLVGTVAKLGSDGSCWGVHLTVDKSWLVSGDGGIEHDDLTTLPDARCH